MDPAEEDALLELVRNGDKAALEELLRLYLPSIHAICRRICLNGADADDATQEALISVARGAAGFKGQSSFRTWVHRVTTNACLDEVRRIRRRPLPSDSTVEESAPETEEPPALVEQSAVRGDLRAALEELPMEFRTAVVLRDVGDLEYAEIAAILDLKAGTVKSRIARGRAMLASIFTAMGTDSPVSSSKVAKEP